MNKNNLRLHCLVTMTQMLNILEQEKLLKSETVKEIQNFLSNNQLSVKKPKILTYGERASNHLNPTASKLFTLMEQKKTNLCVAADVIKKKGTLSGFLHLFLDSNFLKSYWRLQKEQDLSYACLKLILISLKILMKI